MRSELNSCIQRLILISGTVFLTLLASCGDSGNKKSWDLFREAAQDELERSKDRVRLSNADIRQILVENVDIFKSMVNLCEAYPKIRRVEREGRSVGYYHEGKSNNNLKSAVRTLRMNLETIDASSMTCGRRTDFEGSPLSVVSFAMESVGLSVSGSSKQIVYESKWTEKNIKIEGFTIAGRTYLGVYGWYLYKSQ